MFLPRGLLFDFHIKSKTRCPAFRDLPAPSRPLEPTHNPPPGQLAITPASGCVLRAHLSPRPPPFPPPSALKIRRLDTPSIDYMFKCLPKPDAAPSETQKEHHALVASGGISALRPSAPVCCISVNAVTRCPPEWCVCACVCVLP